MPNFPRYESKGQLTTQQPSPLAPEDNTGKMVQAAGEVGKNAIEIGLKWKQATDTIQKTTAMANFKTGMLDIQDRAGQDPDYNNSDKYFKEIEKLRSDNLKGFKDKQVEQEMASEFNYSSRVGQIQVENVYRKKTVAVGQANSLKMLDILSQNPNTTEADI